MPEIQLFPVERKKFDGGPAFRSYLAKHYDSSQVANALTILTALTKHSATSLRSALEAYDLEVVEELGALLKIRTRAPGESLEAYATLDDDSGVLIFYTNFRKTEDIPRLSDFLRADPKTYPLFLRPPSIQKLLDKLVEQHQDLAVVDFTAKRYPGSRHPAQVRPSVAPRTFSYWASDGRQTLQELTFQYGVLPTRAVVEIPERAKFGVDGRGFYTLERGDITILLGLIGEAIDESRKSMEAFDGCSFQVFDIRVGSRTVKIPSSKPVGIRLSRELRYDEASAFKSRLDEYGYTVLGFHAEEGSLFVSTDVVSKTGHPFRIKADSREIRMLPEGQPALSSFMEFYEFVLNAIDPEARLRI